MPKKNNEQDTNKIENLPCPNCRGSMKYLYTRNHRDEYIEVGACTSCGRRYNRTHPHDARNLKTDLKDPRNWKWEAFSVTALTGFLWATRPYGLAEAFGRSVLALVSLVIVIYAYVALMMFTGVFDYRERPRLDLK